jgi:hypothetical protein
MPVAGEQDPRGQSDQTPAHHDNVCHLSSPLGGQAVAPYEPILRGG